MGIKSVWTLKNMPIRCFRIALLLCLGDLTQNIPVVSHFNQSSWPSWLSMMLSTIYDFALYLLNAFENWTNMTNQFFLAASESSLLRVCHGLLILTKMVTDLKNPICCTPDDWRMPTVLHKTRKWSSKSICC